jgi:hypothetical protein
MIRSLVAWGLTLGIIAGGFFMGQRAWVTQLDRPILQNANRELLTIMRDIVAARTKVFDAGKLAATEGAAGKPTTRLPSPDDSVLFISQISRPIDKDGNRLAPFARELPRGNGFAFLDAWGRDFRYRIEGDTFIVTSAGEDGTFGTADDQDSDDSPARLSTKKLAAEFKQ